MKPTVFNYADYEKALAKIQKQADEIIRLKEENTNMRIHIRILEEERRRKNDDGMGREGNQAFAGTRI